ncbi:MAG: hypothetical protein JWP81_2184 [Ferruginibacter sp.]|nr:hypothetical protein [Ferruginibacter sp.]
MTEEKSNWKIEKTVEGETITWLPLLTLIFDFSPKRIIGITDNGCWTAQWHNGAIETITSREKCYNILVCLEKERSEFESLLKEAITKHNITIEQFDTFPISDLIKFSMQSMTSWSTSAAFWLREEDMDKEFEEIISNFIKNKDFSQQARHQAFKVLKKWQRQQLDINASC